MPRAFVRQLGYEPGVQLNPLRDRSASGVLGIFDQTAAIVARFPRGRIDRPFRVNRSNITALLGKPAAIALSALNEAYVHVYEALKNGAREVVVSRLVPAAAALKWIKFTSAAASTYSVETAQPTTGTLGLRYLGAHSDGIKVKVNGIITTAGADTSMVQVIVLDADDYTILSITGSLDPASKDEFGQSNYLPDVAMVQTDMLEVSTVTGATIASTHDCYGKGTDGKAKYAASGNLAHFVEGGTTYASTDIDRAITALRNSQEDFGYIMGGGTRSVELISKLADLGYETNRQFVFDVPGDLSVSAAIAWVQALGFGVTGRDHYPQAYWAPLRATDPLNSGRAVFGTSGAQVGYRCARNAQTNAYGFSEKNRPIAGLNGALGRSAVTQLVALSDNDLSDLAAAKINPVVFQTYADASGYFFTDSLTCANTARSYRKLVTVAEMSAHIDETVARFGRGCLQLPMSESIKRMTDFLERFLGHAYASGWLVDSDDKSIKPFEFTVQRNAANPVDRMDVNYWLHYDGVARQIHVQQAIV